MGIVKRTRLAAILCGIGFLLSVFAETQTTASWATGLGIAGSGAAVLFLAWEGKGQRWIVALLLAAGVVASMGTLLSADPNALEAAVELLVAFVVAAGEVTVAVAMFFWAVAVWIGWYWLLLVAVLTAYTRLRLNQRQPTKS